MSQNSGSKKSPVFNSTTPNSGPQPQGIVKGISHGSKVGGAGSHKIVQISSTFPMQTNMHGLNSRLGFNQKSTGLRAPTSNLGVDLSAANLGFNLDSPKKYLDPEKGLSHDGVMTSPCFNMPDNTRK